MKEVKNIKREPVKSSNLKSVGFDAKAKTLEIEFQQGNVYQYHPVTQAGFNAMMAADSMGTWFFNNIRKNSKIETLKIS